MTREENLQYRRSFPYDAMGDYSVFGEAKEVEAVPDEKEPELSLPAKPTK